MGCTQLQNKNKNADMDPRKNHVINELIKLAQDSYEIIHAKAKQMGSVFGDKTQITKFPEKKLRHKLMEKEEEELEKAL